MDIYTQILSFTIPSFIVAAIAYLLINKMVKAENDRHNFELQKLAAQNVTPAKLRAFERMVIFLERIAPESMLTKMTLNDINALQLQKALLQQIRQEWEHNLAQQLYINNDTWVLLSNAKESTIQLINTCAANCTLDSSALEYAKVIIETYNQSTKTPSSVALSMLKADLAKIK